MPSNSPFTLIRCWQVRSPFGSWAWVTSQAGASARTLLPVVSYWFMRRGVSEISFTVTEANKQAIDLHAAEGYTFAHSFDAAVWERSAQAW